MIEQMELAAAADREKASRLQVAPVDTNRADTLVALLRGRGWVKREELTRDLGWGDRMLRLTKAASDGQVISDSHLGYKLLIEATPDEVSHAVNELRSRAAELTAYSIAMEQRYHRMGRDAK